jgi:hypothetical protein
MELDHYIKSKNIKEIFRGQAWSKNCREWVYYDCILNIDKLKEKFNLLGFNSPPLGAVKETAKIC